jgi:Protein of unknown function (DUF1574)
MPAPTLPVAKQRGSSLVEPLQSSHLPPYKRLVLTASVCAAVIFVLLNLVLWKSVGEDKPKGNAHDSVQDLWNGGGSIDLTVNGFKSLAERPTVVLLGSSLIMHPFWAMDVELNPKIEDIFHHHASTTLINNLAAVGCPNQRVYSLAVFGEMASDAYIFVNELLKGNKKPDVLVFGIAPRDFGDSFLTAPMATFTFRKMIGLNNFARYADAYLPGWQDKADFVATHACYFYGKRWRLQHEIGKGFDRVVRLAGINTLSPQDQPSMKTKEQPGFLMVGMTKDRWESSEKEYRQRYRGIGSKDFEVQMGFLQKLLARCQERGIKVVLVDMPLTDINRDLLPPDFYNKIFRPRVKDIAQHNGHVKFIDLGDSTEFTYADYWDTSHLNNVGGHKLLRHIVPAIEELIKDGATPASR